MTSVAVAIMGTLCFQGTLLYTLMQANQGRGQGFWFLGWFFSASLFLHLIRMKAVAQRVSPNFRGELGAGKFNIHKDLLVNGVYQELPFISLR